jgi:hypothetical protein
VILSSWVEDEVDVLTIVEKSVEDVELDVKVEEESVSCVIGCVCVLLSMSFTCGGMGGICFLYDLITLD